VRSAQAVREQASKGMGSKEAQWQRKEKRRSMRKASAKEEKGRVGERDTTSVALEQLEEKGKSGTEGTSKTSPARVI